MLKILDTKPQVGIFEIVDGVFLKDTEDVQPVNQGGGFFSGLVPHLHEQDVKLQVKYTEGISPEVKRNFETNKYEYLRWPRGRVDFNIKEGKYHIMSSGDFLSNPANIEKVTREFHIPPYGSGNIVLEKDEGHYGVQK